MNDRLLAIQYRCGSRRALEQIYAKYKRDLFLVAWGMLNDRALAMIPNEQQLRDSMIEYAKGKIPLNEDVEKFIKRQNWLIHQLVEGSRIPHCDCGIDTLR